jgi:phosphatidylserine/phosphatidylglycerophosphate/cardiolipin synthase-like enzyme
MASEDAATLGGRGDELTHTNRTHIGPDRLGSMRFDPSRVPSVALERLVGQPTVAAAVSPDSSYRLVKAALEGATTSVDLYIYNVSADHLLELLAGCIARGVAVRLMYDTHDTRGDEKMKLEALAGAEVRTAPSTGGRTVFTVCHQKYAVIDRKAVLIGSANWAASAIPKLESPGMFKKGNREWLLVVEHSRLAETFSALFQADWDIPELPTPDDLVVEVEAEPTAVHIPSLLAHVPDQLFDHTSFPTGLEMAITPILSPQNYFNTVLALIESAQESIDVQQQYIVDGGGATRRLLEALAAQSSDVEIRVIASPAFRKTGAKDSWEKTASALEAHGLGSSLRAMNLRFCTHCHNKV